MLEEEKVEDISVFSPFLDLDIKTKISNSLQISIDNFSIYIWGYFYDSKKVIAKFNGDFELFKINLIIKTSLGEII